MSSVWGSLDAIKAAVQEGVKEFSQVSHAALAEVRHNVTAQGDKLALNGVSFSGKNNHRRPDEAPDRDGTLAGSQRSHTQDGSVSATSSHVMGATANGGLSSRLRYGSFDSTDTASPPRLTQHLQGLPSAQSSAREQHLNVNSPRHSPARDAAHFNHTAPDRRHTHDTPPSASVRPLTADGSSVTSSVDWATHAPYVQSSASTVDDTSSTPSSAARPATAVDAGSVRPDSLYTATSRPRSSMQLAPQGTGAAAVAESAASDRTASYPALGRAVVPSPASVSGRDSSSDVGNSSSHYNGSGGAGAGPSVRGSTGSVPPSNSFAGSTAGHWSSSKTNGSNGLSGFDTMDRNGVGRVGSLKAGGDGGHANGGGGVGGSNATGGGASSYLNPGDGGGQGSAAGMGSSGGSGGGGGGGAGEEDVRRAYQETKRAYDEMRVLLQKSMAECVRLGDDVVRLEGESRQQQAAAAEAAEVAKQAQREATDVGASLVAAKRDAAASAKALARAQEALEAQTLAHAKDSGVEELKVLQEQLSLTVQKAAAAVDAREAAEARAAAAERARAVAEAARSESDRLRRDAQAEAHAAQAVAEAERSNRAEAQGMSETLRQEGERRARIFNNAVKAAVSKVQRELEQQRDDLSVQFQAAQTQLEAGRSELRAAQEAAEAAREDAAARMADAAAAGNLAVAAEGAAERARAREREAVEAARAADTAKAQAVQVADELRARRLQAEAAARAATVERDEACVELQSTREGYKARLAALDAELVRQNARAEAAAASAARALTDARQAATCGALEHSQADAASCRQRIEELEAEVAQLKLSSSSSAAGKPSLTAGLFAMPTKEDVLAGLGLEIWKDDRLRWKMSSDVETPPGRSAAPAPRGGGGGTGGTLASSGRRLVGHVPLRVWLLAAYLSLLHILVMVSFTHSRGLSKLQDCEQMGLGIPNAAAVVSSGHALP